MAWASGDWAPDIACFHVGVDVRLYCNLHLDLWRLEYDSSKMEFSDSCKDGESSMTYYDLQGDCNELGQCRGTGPVDG